MDIKSSLKNFQLQIGLFYFKLVKLPSEQVGVITPSVRPASVSIEDRRVQVAAAKARITLDKKLGVKTPDWIVALSEEPTGI